MSSIILGDMEALRERKSVHSCRAMYNNAIEHLQDTKEIFKLALDIEIDFLKTG